MQFLDVVGFDRPVACPLDLLCPRRKFAPHLRVLSILLALFLAITAAGLAQGTDTATHHKGTRTTAHSTRRHSTTSSRRRSSRARIASTKHRRSYRSSSRYARSTDHLSESARRRREEEARARYDRRHHRRRHVSARTLARVHQLHHAFVVSSELRPMAQQLMQQRTSPAYAGVLRYARSHSGEAAAAAYMALGQAYFLDGKFKDAAASFQRAARKGKALDDYADYLGAKAEFAQQQYGSAEQLLQDFAQRHPDSVLIDHAMLLLANIKLGEGDPQAAIAQLKALRGSPLADSSTYLFALAKANQLAGNRQQAQRLYTHIYLDYPTSTESGQVQPELVQMGFKPPFTVPQRLHHADGLYLAGHYAAAATEYQSLASDSSIVGTPQRNGLLARAAVATFKQTHHVDPSQLARLSDTDDNAGATRLYLMVEAARDAKDVARVKALIAQIERRFPTNRWTAEALFSAGNMALVANDLPSAIQYYGDLAQRFPDSAMAPLSHWHAAWLNYRIGDKKTAARWFDEQIERYPTDSHVSAAIYWRGVVYEEYEKNPTAAAACYRKLVRVFPQYYYTGLAQQRLAHLGNVDPETLPILVRVDDPPVPVLTTDIPEDDIHVDRARLLANAGLNQYIVPEISASPDSRTWAAYAEAQLYSSYGENWRALHLLKQKVHTYFAVPMDAIPRPYWDILFPQPYWSVLQRDSEQQGLDPYLVASLIRQESEFNPGAISYANAWGLMQLLPRVGSELSRKERVRPYRTSYLLNPDVNLKLGTAYFRELMDEFNGQPEYALAAYNAGDDRVKAWLANGPYASIPEFVESIPFTQTREYVEAIMRNREMYRRLYAAPSTNQADSSSGSSSGNSVARP